MTRKSNTSGGAAGAGGFSFQAAVSAIAYVHTLRGTRVQWLDSLATEIPFGVSSETGGPGDDISLELPDGSLIEVQVKKGLRADGKFWSVVDSLSEGISSGRCAYGILIVCPSSSNTIRSGYANAIKRVGDERDDDPSEQQSALTKHLKQKGYNPAKICTHLRIQTVSALSDQKADITAAHAELGHVCRDRSQIKSAWNALYADALLAIESKGRRTSASLVSVLQSSNIVIKSDENDTPAAISHTLLKWIDATTEKFSVLGIPEPLSTDTAWLQLHASVGDAAIERSSSMEDALQAYHALGEISVNKGEKSIDAKTIGTFRKHCVVVGGPGSGKSLLLRVLAREFGKEALVSLRVSLRDLSKRIETTGCTIEEGLLSLGLAESGVSPEQLRAAGLSELVFLCDGLDECGNRQLEIASGLRDIAVSSPFSRIIVTTRPIGYDTSELRPWRHYEIAPLNPDDATNHLEALCRGALGTVADSDDQLHADIAAYINASETRKFISKSPLLMAFAAALFLKQKTLGKSKIDLYTRIFKLIDDAPAPRKDSPSAAPKAVRDNALNHLGWLVSTSPLLTAEEIEKQCAENIERGLGEPYLKALSLTQSSITYWEEAGLIERIRHSGQDLITFIHKTCGEFAAARHLATIDKTEARQLIEKDLDNPEWEEILDFATQTSLAKMIADAVIERAETAELSSRVIDRAFRVLARPEIHFAPSDLAVFLERIFALAQDEDRQKAYRVAACMANNDMSRVSEAAERSERLLKAKAEWSQLIGWTVLVCHFPDRLDRFELEEAGLHYAALGNDANLFIRPEDFFLGRQPDRELFQLFLINALEKLLEDQTAERQDKLIGAVSKLKALRTVGFMRRVGHLLRRIDCEDVLPMFGMVQDMKPSLSLDMSQFDAAYRKLFEDVVAGAFIAEAPPERPSTGMKHLAAFFQLTEIMEVPGDDLSVWKGDGDLAQVHELLRATVYVFELSPERLVAEVRSAYDATQARTDFDVFLDVPSVDVAEIDWKRAQQIEFDDAVLEELVHHPSLWLKVLAAQILDSRLRGTERFEACKRMLETGQNKTLHIAAIMAAALPDHKGHELIVARLNKSLTPGTHYLFEQLAENEFPVERSHAKLLEAGLISSSAKVAEFAAKWCGASVGRSDVWLLPLLRQAFEYWIENEQPYPKNRGVVPDSPRAALYSAMRAIDNFKFDELAKLSMDSRRDVSKLAIDDLVSLATGSNDDRNQLVGEICAKRFPSALCGKLLDPSIPYSQDNLTQLCALLEDGDPAYRRVAIRILSHPSMDQVKALGLATQMKDDANGTVRDAAYRCLDTFRQTCIES